MNQILDPPNTYDAGLNFNYAVWTADTKLDLINVPWNNDYRDIVRFDSKTERDEYLDTAALTGVRITNASYAKLNAPVMIGIPFNKAIKYNYLRASNPAQPLGAGVDEGRNFYYFITDVKYVAPQTTQITVQLDVWQTFGYDVSFGNCFITRGHIGMANSKRMDNFGRDYLNVPEGLDTGSDYVVRAAAQETAIIPFGADAYDILVASTVDLLADPGTVSNPKIVSAQGGTISLMPSGASYYVFDGDSGSFGQYLASIKETPWVAQGITSITLIPNIKRYFPSYTYGAVGVPKLAPSGVPNILEHKMLSNFRENMLGSTSAAGAFPAKYRNLDKFKVFPYSVIEMTTWSATPIILKPEAWNRSDADIVEMANVVPPGQRIVFYPAGYNAIGDPETNRDNGDFLDYATMIQSFPTVAIVNNMSSMYLAANAASIAYQKDSADWSQQKALAGAGTAYDQASAAMQLMDSLAMTARNSDIASTYETNQNLMNQSIISGAGSIAKGAMSGSIGGGPGVLIGGVGGGIDAAAGIAGSMFQQASNDVQQSIRNSANMANTRDQLGNAGYVRDTNNDLAKFAARGDYENTIAGINAKVQDSRFVQPQMVGQVGGDTFNIIHLRGEVNLRFKTLDNAHVAMIGDYWLRYGYAVSRFATPPADLKCMTKFTYWKMAETYLTGGPMPESFKQAIRGIFEKGVTVWTNPADIGNIALDDNTIIGGISL